ncbi:unnamed protein product [Linum tenue]|uniref:Uncharacterized protein n=1 Tax=Linum tenue TaxID=586396 RepID=A0AAV0JNC0_9ROSI|nr:unnamed protein product [Linum tenue]
MSYFRRTMLEFLRKYMQWKFLNLRLSTPKIFSLMRSVQGTKSLVEFRLPTRRDAHDQFNGDGWLEGRRIHPRRRKEGEGSPLAILAGRRIHPRRRKEVGKRRYTVNLKVWICHSNPRFVWAREIGGYTEPQEDTVTEFISPGDGHQFQRRATNLKICGLGYKSMLKRIHCGERDWRRKETRFACPDI